MVGRQYKLDWGNNIGYSKVPPTDRRFEQNFQTLASVLWGGLLKKFSPTGIFGAPFGRLTRPSRRSFGRGLNVGPWGGGLGCMWRLGWYKVKIWSVRFLKKFLSTKCFFCFVFCWLACPVFSQIILVIQLYMFWFFLMILQGLNYLAAYTGRAWVWKNRKKSKSQKITLNTPKLT